MKDKSFACFGSLVVVRRIAKSDGSYDYFYGYSPRDGEYAWTTDLQSAKFFPDVLTAEDEAKKFMNKLCEFTRTYLDVEVAKLVLMNL